MNELCRTMKLTVKEHGNDSSLNIVMNKKGRTVSNVVELRIVKVVMREVVSCD